LHRCAGSGHIEIVELLLNYNAIPYIYNEVGLSPKDIASLCEHHDIFEIFTYYESL
jgi:ankyrin repeat protein